MSKSESEGAIARPLTDTDLDSLEKLLSEATPAPWRAWGAGDEYWIDGPDERGLVYGYDGEMHERDAALCAALRNLAPALIEEIRASRAWRKEAEGLLREARELFATFDAESRKKLRTAYPTLFRGTEGK